MYMYFSPSMMLQLLQRIEIGHYKTVEEWFTLDRELWQVLCFASLVDSVDNYLCSLDIFPGVFLRLIISNYVVCKSQAESFDGRLWHVTRCQRETSHPASARIWRRFNFRSIFQSVFKLTCFTWVWVISRTTNVNRSTHLNLNRQTRFDIQVCATCIWRLKLSMVKEEKERKELRKKRVTVSWLSTSLPWRHGSDLHIWKGLKWYQTKPPEVERCEP